MDKGMWWVLKRNGVSDIVWVNPGCDPLYGRGTWDLAINKGFDTFQDAADWDDTNNPT